MLVVDVFPVQVTLPDGSAHRTCRLRIDGAGTIIWRWDHQVNEAMVLVQSERLAVEEGPRRWRLTSDDGDVLVERQNSCGCGHPMKRWRPPGPARVVAG